MKIYNLPTCSTTLEFLTMLVLSTGRLLKVSLVSLHSSLLSFKTYNALSFLQGGTSDILSAACQGGLFGEADVEATDAKQGSGLAADNVGHGRRGRCGAGVRGRMIVDDDNNHSINPPCVPQRLFPVVKL